MERNRKHFFGLRYFWCFQEEGQKRQQSSSTNKWMIDGNEGINEQLMMK